MSNSSQSSVDSVSLFLSDLSQVLEPSLSQAVIVLDSVMECAVVGVQCMYILAVCLFLCFFVCQFRLFVSFVCFVSLIVCLLVGLSAVCFLFLVFVCLLFD